MIAPENFGAMTNEKNLPFLCGALTQIIYLDKFKCLHVKHISAEEMS